MKIVVTVECPDDTVIPQCGDSQYDKMCLAVDLLTDVQEGEIRGTVDVSYIT